MSITIRTPKTHQRILVECMNNPDIGIEASLEGYAGEIERGAIDPKSYNIKVLFGEMFGYDKLTYLEEGPQAMSVFAENETASTSFSYILTQLMTKAVRAKEKAPEYKISKLVENIPTPFIKETEPGMTGLGELGTKVINEGEEFPSIGRSEQYWETPFTRKYGAKAFVTREMIVHNRFRSAVNDAEEAADAFARRKEYELIDAMYGLDNTFKWNGNSYNTFLSSGTWVNLQVKVLADYTSIDSAYQLYQKMKDLATEVPIVAIPQGLFVPPALMAQAKSIMTATQNRQGADSASIGRFFPTPDELQFPVVSSIFFRNRLINAGVSEADADAIWLLGTPSRMLEYNQNWPLLTIPLNQDSSMAARDVVGGFVVTEKGRAAIRSPQHMVKNTPS